MVDGNVMQRQRGNLSSSPDRSQSAGIRRVVLLLMMMLLLLLMMLVEQEHVVYLGGVWSRGYYPLQTQSSGIAVDRKGGAVPYPHAIIGAAGGGYHVLHEAYIYMHRIVRHVDLLG
jgi:hypothetical protein